MYTLYTMGWVIIDPVNYGIQYLAFHIKTR